MAPAPWWKTAVFTGAPVHVPDGGGDVLVSSLEPEPRFAGRLAADEAVVITERLPRAGKGG